MKNPKRKVITAEVDTFMSNKDMKILLRELFRIEGIPIFQIQINEIKKEK